MTLEAVTSNLDCGDLANTAAVSATNEAAESAGDNLSADAIVVACPDVTVQKVGNGTIAAGGIASFTIIVTNLGPGTAAGVMVSDALPGGLTWVENPDTLCTITGGASLSCNIGTLKEGETFTVTVQATTTAIPTVAICRTRRASPGTNEDPHAGD